MFFLLQFVNLKEIRCLARAPFNACPKPPPILRFCRGETPPAKKPRREATLLDLKRARRLDEERIWGAWLFEGLSG